MCERVGEKKEEEEEAADNKSLLSLIKLSKYTRHEHNVYAD